MAEAMEVENPPAEEKEEEEDQTVVIAGGGCVVLLLVLVFSYFAYHRCWFASFRKCGKSGSSPSPSPSKSKTTVGPVESLTTSAEPLTTSAAPTAVEGCFEGGSAESCFGFLNKRYMGYDEADPKSPLGVTMRGRPRFEMPWYFCGAACFRAQPDCYLAGALTNHKMMLTEQNTISIVMDYPVYFIFQAEAVENWITKCAYQYDGAAFKKFYGGCGTGGDAECDDAASAYKNKCREDPSKEADFSCPSVIAGTCDAERQDEYPHTCSWKGPAWYSPTHPGAEPNMSGIPNTNVNELRDMVKQRLSSQSHDKSTHDGKTLTSYWNELTMDARVIEVLMDEDPFKVIAALGYVKGNKMANGWAKQYNAAYNNRFQIISIDTSADVVNGAAGPFGPDEYEEEGEVDAGGGAAGGGGGGGGEPVAGSWKTCNAKSSACCNPRASPVQYCPTGDACEGCEGDTCECAGSHRRRAKRVVV